MRPTHCTWLTCTASPITAPHYAGTSPAPPPASRSNVSISAMTRRSTFSLSLSTSATPYGGRTATERSSSSRPVTASTVAGRWCCPARPLSWHVWACVRTAAPRTAAVCALDQPCAGKPPGPGAVPPTPRHLARPWQSGRRRPARPGGQVRPPAPVHRPLSSAHTRPAGAETRAPSAAGEGAVLAAHARTACPLPSQPATVSNCTIQAPRSLTWSAPPHPSTAPLRLQAPA